jgi:hypothetical protein
MVFTLAVSKELAESRNVRPSVPYFGNQNDGNWIRRF